VVCLHIHSKIGWGGGYGFLRKWDMGAMGG
jgi:hypothetical protein